ncbi:MAG: GxxExxY protein [Kiritimatiellales bacterium]
MRRLEQEGYDLMAAAFEVYNQMGSGFLEEIYQECLEVELGNRNIPFVSQEELTVCYKEKLLKKKYRPDLFVFGEIIVELKAVKNLCSDHEAQLLNYLKGTGKRVGYLINFGNPKELEWKRMAL